MAGRVDLRRFPLARAVEVWLESNARGVKRSTRFRFEGRTWASIDFSGSDLRQLDARGMAFVDCVFDRANLRNAIFCEVSVRSCSFLDAEMRGCYLSLSVGREGGSFFEDADFSGARFGGADVKQARFSRCNLSFSRWGQVCFIGCEFIDVRFGGPMSDVGFDARRLPEDKHRGYPAAPVDGPTFERVSFESASFRYVGFDGCVIGEVAWPASPLLVGIDNYAELLGVARRIATEEGERYLDSMDLKFSLSTSGFQVHPQATYVDVLDADQPPARTDFFRVLSVLVRASEELGRPGPYYLNSDQPFQMPSSAF